MIHQWPKETVFRRVEIEIEDRNCPFCETYMHLCDHRHRRLFTLEGPLHLVSKLAHCPEESCPGHHKTFSAQSELTLAPPYWIIGWDLFAWIGQRRFSRHWSNPQIREELIDSYGVKLCEETIRLYVNRYQTMVAAREQDFSRLSRKYEEIEDLILTIDGLQPEKGHETLYAVRELRGRQIWFAEAVLSSSDKEIKGLIEKAKEIAQMLGKPVTAWISDKQAAFVNTIAEVFPGVVHRYCENHFERGLAAFTLAADSQAKVKMRRKVRGLRRIEREILKQRRQESSQESQEDHAKHVGEEMEENPVESPVKATQDPNISQEKADEVVLDYCSAIRGVLNDSQGGPLHPPGLRMAEGLTDIRGSLERNLEAKKGGLHKGN